MDIDARDMTAGEMLARISSMFALPTLAGDDQVGVVCPLCPPEPPYEMHYVHLLSAQTYPGTDNPTATPSLNSGAKGDVTVLRFYCEAQHHVWALVFAGQKGETKVQLVSMEDSLEDHPLPNNVVPFARRGEPDQLDTWDEPE